MQHPDLSPSDVIRTVARALVVTTEDILGRSRKQRIVLARHVAMNYVREEMGYTYQQIADAFGGRDHTSVLHACQKVSRSTKRDVVRARELVYSILPRHEPCPYCRGTGIADAHVVEFVERGLRIAADFVGISSRINADIERGLPLEEFTEYGNPHVIHDVHNLGPR